MKGRILHLMVVIALLCAITLPASGHTSKLFFVAWNDTLPLTLPGEVMPYEQDGTVFVPHTIFDLTMDGITATFHAERNTLTLLSRSQRLIFDLTEGRVTDENGVTRQAQCILRDSTAFVPLELCANYFGLSASLLKGANDYTVVRLTNGQEIYDDAHFLPKTEQIIAYRVDGYEGGQTPDLPSGDQLPPTVYLTAFGVEHATIAMDVLSNVTIPLTVFFTADEILENPSLVRTASAKGYMVGLTVGQGETDVSSALRRGNDALRLVAGHKTLLACLTQEQSQGIEGYCIMDRDLVVPTTTAMQLEVESMVLCTDTCRLDIQMLTVVNARFRPLRETSPFRIIPAA
ncbi:MAG: hypothetical protein J6K84_02375 [Oscillospiraceae bacterium]|nr:hypothetical protein [Oscillospiraceae bacterium]